MRLDSNSNGDFKSLSSTLCKTKLDSLLAWACTAKAETTSLSDSPSQANQRHNCSPFPLSRDVNKRFLLWSGDITTLEVDAITNITNESLTKSCALSERLVAACGHQLKEDFQNNLQDWRSSDVFVSKAYNLPAKYILHTIGPEHKNKLKVTAESSLHACYRNSLYKAKELNLRTIALCSIGNSEFNFPANLVAHVGLRTIRRFLEKFPAQIVILCVTAHELGVYEVLAPLYFPRDNLEERSALWQLPKDTGGELGEPTHPDRQIRIIRNPQHSVLMRHSEDKSEANYYEMEGASADAEGNDINQTAYSSGTQQYSQMQSDLDRQQLLGDRTRNEIYDSVVSSGIEGIEQQERYERLLQRAHNEDLNEVSGIGCLYQSGVDRLGRPVIVFCGKWFPAQNIDLEKALLYLIKLLDPIVKGDYVIAYFHTLTSTNNYPSLQWLREVYGVLPYKYKKNLKAFYIVHPTFWTKMVTWWFTTFMAPAIKAKVHSLPGVEHLYSAISKDQLEIPAYITEYDMATNGLHYFTPLQPASS